MKQLTTLQIVLISVPALLLVCWYVFIAPAVIAWIKVGKHRTGHTLRDMVRLRFRGINPLQIVPAYCKLRAAGIDIRESDLGDLYAAAPSDFELAVSKLIEDQKESSGGKDRGPTKRYRQPR